MNITDWIAGRRAVRQLHANVDRLDQTIQTAEGEYPERVRQARQTEDLNLFRFVKMGDEHTRQMKDFRGILVSSIARLRHG